MGLVNLWKWLVETNQAPKDAQRPLFIASEYRGRRVAINGDSLYVLMCFQNVAFRAKAYHRPRHARAMSAPSDALPCVCWCETKTMCPHAAC